MGLFDLQKSAMICPHCQTKGTVHTKQVSVKTGISAGRVMGGLLTGGFSSLGTGLSRKEKLTDAHCATCSNTWHF
jgi:hypothetical protein